MRTVHTGAHFGYMCAQGNPPMWISFPLAIAESQAILEEEDRRRREQMPPGERESTPCGADSCRARGGTCLREQGNKFPERAPRKSIRMTILDHPTPISNGVPFTAPRQTAFTAPARRSELRSPHFATANHGAASTGAPSLAVSRLPLTVLPAHARDSQRCVARASMACSA